LLSNASAIVFGSPSDTSKVRSRVLAPFSLPEKLVKHP
jgi:hypothetical protein